MSEGADVRQGVEFRWDLRNLQITTLSVEKTLEPLLVQVFIFAYFFSRFQV